MPAKVKEIPATETEAPNSPPGAEPVPGPPLAAVDGRGPTRTGPTVEHALYAGLLLLALALRLYRLGTLNVLSPVEAAQAWPAWLGANAGQWPVPFAPISPLLYTAQRFLFLLTGGGSEFWARFAPAVAGAGLVLAAWPLRPRLGRAGALIAAGLLAVDPWLLSFSRLGDGAVLSAFTGLLLLAWLFDAAGKQPPSLRQMDRLALTAGLFVISGPLAWLLLPLILAAVFWLRPWPAFPGRRAAAIFGGTVLIGATGLLAHLSGLATIGESLGAAIALLTGGPSVYGAGYSVGWGLLRLLVDQPFLLLFGGGGLVLALLTAGSVADSRRRAWLRVLAAGVGWGLVCLLLPGRGPLSLLVLGLPLLLLAAQAAAALLRFATDRLQRTDAALVAVTLGVLLVTAAFWTGNATTALRDGNLDLRLLLFYLLIPALGLFFVWWSGVRTSGQVFGLLVLASFFLANLSSSWMLNLRPELLHNSRSLFAETGDDGLALLVADVSRLSSLRAGDPTEAPVYLLVPPDLQPLLGWHLRQMRYLRWQTGVDPAALDGRSLVIGPAGATLRLPDDFIGSSYTVTQRWLPTDLTGTVPRLRWALYREQRMTPTVETVELWVKRE